VKRNALLALKVGDDWFEYPPLVKAAVEDFFSNHFSSPVTERPKLDGVTFPMLSAEENMCNSPYF
jgi:hypothetical protein